MMTNDGLKAIIEKYGERLFLIITDNGRRMMLGNSAQRPEEQRSVNDLVFENFGGVDCVGLKHYDRTWNGDIVPFYNWFVTASIQMFSTLPLDNGDNWNLPDLNKFRG